MTLDLDSVSYRYAGATGNALADVSLELAAGDVVGIVGASESGKSTLCLVASGLAPGAIGGSLGGRVSIDGMDTSDTPSYVLAQRSGILFQQPAAQLSATAPTVWEEVAVGPRNLALPLAEVIERTWAALQLLRIEALAEREPGRLSGGQMQLVALAGVLAMRPAYLVLDEPTAQLDPAGTELVARAIDGLAGQGAGILIAEQKTDLLAGLCHRVIVLDDGKVVLDGPADEVLGDPALREWGVEPPAPVRLRRALAEAGVARELPL
jgi:energy-coupling factor transporter ATP-binding protein EcfA2